MKGLVALFLSTAFFGIAWGYTSKESRTAFIAVVKKNIFPIALAAAAVAVAVVFSVNSTLRLV